MFNFVTVKNGIMETDNIIGKNMKALREHNGFSQDSLANYLGIKRESISYFETGSRAIPIEIMEKLCDLYGIDLADIFETDDNKRRDVVTCAFRTSHINEQDLPAIAKLKKVVKNYLKINNLLKEA